MNFLLLALQMKARGITVRIVLVPNYGNTLARKFSLSISILYNQVVCGNACCSSWVASVVSCPLRYGVHVS